MWLNERLLPGEETPLPYLGTVVQAEADGLWVDAHQRLIQVRPLLPGGALPEAGEQVLVVPGREGFYCLGSAEPLRGPGGGWIRFLPDGGVEINGAVITAQGVLRPAEQEDGV